MIIPAVSLIDIPFPLNDSDDGSTQVANEKIFALEKAISSVSTKSGGGKAAAEVTMRKNCYDEA